MSGHVMTVLGPIDPARLGVAMTHEHVFCDLRCWQAEARSPREAELASAPVGIEMLGALRRDALVCADNLVLDDEALAREELRELVAQGGSTLVELSVAGLEPRVERLPGLARDLGLNVVAGCGWYVADSHPPDVAAATVASLTGELLGAIADGLGASGVRPGVIGEIGTSQPVHPDEWKALEAACRAQRATGLPLFVHVHPMADGRTAPEVVRFVLAQGVAPARVNVCHIDGQLDLDYQAAVLELGVFVSFDTFGLEAYYDRIDLRSSFDAERIDALVALLERGYARQLLLSQDVCMKMQLRRFGGHGYGHVLRHIVPALLRRGITQETIDVLLRENPRRLLTVQGAAAPSPPPDREGA